VTPQRSLHPGLHLLDGTIRVLLAEALFPLTGLLTAAFLTRRLGPEDYGLLTLAATIVGWIEWTITSVFSRAAIKFVGEAYDWRPVGVTITRLYLGVSGAAALVLWLLAAPIAVLLDEATLRLYLQLFTIDIPLFGLAQAHRNILIGLGSFRQRALAGASRWLARLFLIVVLVELGFSVPGAILGSLGASLIELFVSRMYVRPFLTSRSSFSARQVWRYAAPLFLSTLSLGLYTNLDLLALKALGGSASQVGIFGAARNLSLIPGFFAAAIAPLLQATLGHLLQAGEREEARAMERQALRMVFRLLPFVVVCVGAAQEIVTWLFGPLFSSAAPLFAALMIGALALVVVSIVSAILIADGKPRETITLTGPLVPLALVGHLLIIPRLGALGAALVSMSVAWIGALIALLVVSRLWRILPPTGTIWRSIAVSAGAYALAVLWQASGVFLILKLTTLCFLIMILFFTLGEFTVSELTTARSLLRWSSPSPQS
jgi:O-antigen/teichoic acid export membrane protein